MPVVSVASMPTTKPLSVVLIRWPMLPGERAWWLSPQPTSPSSVVTLTMTQSRLVMVPMPSDTWRSLGTRKLVG